MGGWVGEGTTTTKKTNKTSQQAKTVDKNEKFDCVF